MPISQLGTGDEKEIVVVKDQSPPLTVGAPPGVGELEWLSSLSSAVLLIRIGSVDASLSDETDWITSAVTAEIVDVVKDTIGWGLSKGSSLRFQQEGGELQLAGRHVRAVLDWASAFKKGKTYLVFASPSEQQDELNVSPTAAYEVGPASRLVPLMSAESRRREADVPIDTAIDRIRKAKDN